ncbi:virulence RhuM family protein [Legionella drozanskii]|uniref:Uncharacterized protein n=1 Tax=Legionella drozanskii LLAP-1 TaxID=1212489 RepID=A0A0W0SVK7_9GAMM|nr:virulence RhuM family protein [Legionella drozanskii]KTC87394.1 hypothetical protein Ldro_1013 [Legionella drozanskii LLAP-1]
MLLSLLAIELIQEKEHNLGFGATQVLKEYLLQGYSLNEARLKQQLEAIDKLKIGLALIQSAQLESLDQIEAKGLLTVLTEYTHSFILLNQYDTGHFPKAGLSKGITEEISIKEAMYAIHSLKEKLITQGEATPLFGNSRDDGFVGILGNIVQSFNGEYLYPSIEEQAAHLFIL